MIPIPAHLVTRYTTFIGHSGVPPSTHQYYVKWLRYYLDFCHKYDFQQNEKQSLSGFVKKLKEKNKLKNKESRRIMPFPFITRWPFP